LGCTEFSLLPQEVLKPLKIIDSLNALADASITAAQPTLMNKYEQ
jgi:aspartate/glutamate racemase